MERPIELEGDAAQYCGAVPATSATATHGRALSPAALALACAAAAALVAGTIGHATGHAIAVAIDLTPSESQQWAMALGFALGGLGGISAIHLVLARTGPTVLSDRTGGCAWFGAPDAVVVQAFLLGGALTVAEVLVWPAHAPSWIAAEVPDFADWLLPPAMLFAFAAVSVVPVAEELMLRGALFATARATLTTIPAAAIASAGSLLPHALGLHPFPTSSIGALALGAAAMVLRLRHAALAPAIAVHCGYNLTRCVVAALG